MQMRFFTIPALEPDENAEALNRLLAGGRVAGVERAFVADGAASFWSVVVTLVEGAGSLPASMKSGSARKLDYREILSEADFEIFARLRVLRKQVAERDGVPPYAVFSNEQLAALVRARVTTVSALARVEGVGAARVERYAGVFLPVLQVCFTEKTGEASSHQP